MEIRIGSWFYNLWQFTFDISNIFGDLSQPQKTTRKQFKLRILQMFCPAFVILVIAALLWLLITIVCNTATILSGNGVYVTWDCGHGYYVKPFRPSAAQITLRTSFFDFDKTIWIVPQLMAAVLWIVGLAASMSFVMTHASLFQHLNQMVFHMSFLWSILLQIGTAVLYFAVLMAAAFGLMKYSDKAERANQRYVRSIIYEARETNSALPPEIVTFVDHDHDDAAVGV